MFSNGAVQGDRYIPSGGEMRADMKLSTFERAEVLDAGLVPHPCRACLDTGAQTLIHFYLKNAVKDFTSVILRSEIYLCALRGCCILFSPFVVFVILCLKISSPTMTGFLNSFSSHHCLLPCCARWA